MLMRFNGGLNVAEALKLRKENANQRLLKEIISEDLPLFKMLATNRHQV
jgi:hypothetical protein